MKSRWYSGGVISWLALVPFLAQVLTQTSRSLSVADVINESTRYAEQTVTVIGTLSVNGYARSGRIGSLRRSCGPCWREPVALRGVIQTGFAVLLLNLSNVVEVLSRNCWGNW